jgi:hypothetical protein
MCHKKIKTNLEGEKPDFLCVIHSKKHIPKKRITNKENQKVIIPKYDYKRKKDVKK